MMHSTKQQVLSLMTAAGLLLASSTALAHDAAVKDKGLAGSWALSLLQDQNNSAACIQAIGLDGAEMEFTAAGSSGSIEMYKVAPARVEDAMLLAWSYGEQGDHIGFSGRYQNPLSGQIVAVQSLDSRTANLTDSSFEVSLRYVVLAAPSKGKSQDCEGIVVLSGVRTGDAAPDKKTAPAPEEADLTGAFRTKIGSYEASLQGASDKHGAMLTVELPEGLIRAKALSIELPTGGGTISMLMIDPVSGAHIGIQADYQPGVGLSGHMLVLEPTSGRSLHGELVLRP